MDGAAGNIGETLGGQPTVEAELRNVIGTRVLQHRRVFPHAAAQFTAALDKYTQAQGRNTSEVADYAHEASPTCTR